MTETASLITITHPFKGGHGSIGKLMPGYEVKLDESGEIIVRGASVSSGYWTATGSVNRDDGEWLHTGDIGAMDDAGNFYFKGRKGDVIVTAAGLNIYPEDLEEALIRQPEVRATCVISWSGAHGTEPVAPLAVIILRDSSASAEAAIERANQNLAEYQWIRRWHVWIEPDFPRTATHKVLKREVAARIKDEVGRTTDEAGRIKDEKVEDESKSSFVRRHPSPPSFIPPPSSFILSTAARISGHAPPVEEITSTEPSADRGPQRGSPAGLVDAPDAGIDLDENRSLFADLREDKHPLKLTTDLKLDSLGRIELLSA